MKKLALLALPLILAACGGNGTAPKDRPYSITMEPLGYSYDGKEYKINNVDVQFFSNAGAFDVRTVDYTAIMLNTKGGRAALDNSVIVPASGTLFGKLRGGYICGNTAVTTCNWMSPDATFANTGPINYPENQIKKFIMPIEWAVAHNTDKSDSAGWYAEFSFSAVQSNGSVIKWKQNYQIVAPAGGG